MGIGVRSRRAGGVNEVLRVGLVGFGAVARVHWRAYQGLRTIQVVAIADMDPRKAATASKECRVKAYGSVEEMLREEALDITCVLTPPAAHEQIVSVCAEAGVHVLCEKPLSLSVESCERMIRICRENEVRLCYGASYRYLPAMLAAREKIARGDIGEVLILRESAVGGSGVKHRGTLDYGHYPKGGPGGSGMGLCDHGIHLIDAFSWLTNLGVTRVWGRGNISGERQLPEFLHLEYANGAIAELLYEDGTFSTDLPVEGIFGWAGGWNLGENDPDSEGGSWQAHPGCIHVHGTEGSLRIFYYANTLFWHNNEGLRQVRVTDEPFPQNFSKQLDAFASAIRINGETPVPGEVGLEAWRVLQNVYSTAT